MNLRASSICRKSTMRIVALASFAPVFCIRANAQWTVVNLHPPNAASSVIYAVDGNHQVGQVDFGAGARAAIWNDTPASVINIHPSGARSTLKGIDGEHQVGNVYPTTSGNNQRASLWTGTASSWVDLHPAGMIYSEALGVSGNTQIGTATINGLRHASFWNGTASSWIDLTPAGATESYGNAVDGGIQGGFSIFGGVHHASIWSGTAASWVDLGPGLIWGMGDGQQVGAETNGACLWTGTASSLVSLRPLGTLDARAVDAENGQQIGYATVNGNAHACIWSGTAASWVDLHGFLPASFLHSHATGISFANGTTRVVGYAWNVNLLRFEAIMWIRQDQVSVPPTSYVILNGLDFGGNLASLLNSDNDKVYVLCDEFDSNGEIQFESTLPAGTVSQLKFKLEGSASRNDLSQFVRMFNYSTNAYTNVSIQNSTIVDSVVEGTITTGVANYYSGTREVKSRVFWVPQADVSDVDGWTQTCDQVLWTMN